MKQSVRLLLVLIVAALALGGCLDPISILTDMQPAPAADGGRVRELPGPTTVPPAEQPDTPVPPIDTSDLIREPVTEADRSNEQTHRLGRHPDRRSARPRHPLQGCARRYAAEELHRRTNVTTSATPNNSMS